MRTEMLGRARCGKGAAEPYALGARGKCARNPLHLGCSVFGTEREGRFKPTNIGSELYHLMEQINQTRFARDQEVPGTNVCLPAAQSCLSFLSKCRDRQDIPAAMVTVREELSRFRKTCTEMELHLRTAQTLRSSSRLSSPLRRHTKP